MPNHLSWRYVFGTVACFVGSTSVLLADMPQQQPVTTPGTLQNSGQRVEQYYQQLQTPTRPQAEPLPQSTAAPSAVANMPNGTHFVLRRVVFTHSALLSPAALNAAVQPYVGQDIGRDGIAKLLANVNALYVKRKITTARAFAKSANVRNGTLNIELVEGRLGKLKIAGLRHVHDGFIRRRIHVKEGQVVDTDTLRTDLIYLNRTTDLQVKALLEPGEQRGQTNILLDVSEPSRHTIDVFVDDNGVESTGRLREGVDAHLYGLFGVDDKFDADVEHSTGANDGSLSYSIPLTPDNGRLSFNYARSQINVVDGAFRNIDITGSSDTSSVGYNQPIIATMNWLFSGIAQYALQDSDTTISGQGIADTHTRQITLGTSLQHQTDGETWGFTQLVTRIHSGEPMLGKDNFVIAPGNAFYIQRLWTSKWAVRVDLGWQASSGRNIPSANLFQIGGLGSVRGYDRGILSGPRGYYADLELHRSIGENWDVYGFVDHGTIYSFYPSSESISGAGPGVLYNFRSWLTVSADVAKSFNTVVPDQSSFRVDARVTFHWR